MERARRARRTSRAGRQSGLRSIDDAVGQLSEQLRRERAQHQFDLAEKEQELAIVLRELAQVRLQLARFEAFANAPSPSASLR